MSAISVFPRLNPSDSSAFVSATDSQPVGSSGFCARAGTSREAERCGCETSSCNEATSCAARFSASISAAAGGNDSMENETAPANNAAAPKKHRRAFA